MRTIMISLCVLGCTVMACGAEAIQLAADGKTDYQVVTADEPAVEVRAAADELAGFLKQVTGAEFPIVKAASAGDGPRIFVGRSKALEKLKLRIEWQRLGPEGFVIRTVDGIWSLRVARKEERSTGSTPFWRT